MAPSNGLRLRTLSANRVIGVEDGRLKNRTIGHHSKSVDADQNPWSSAGPAEFDFRSDVVTTPTQFMLSAISNASLLDDVFREDTTTSSLESFVADLAGHQAALLVLSGTMGNQLSIRTHLTQPPHSVLADATSHIMGWEAGGLASFSGAFALPVQPQNGHHLTLCDIKKHAIISTDVHACPTRLVCLENTLAGTVLPLQCCRDVSAWARAQNPPIALHLDGARLWEAVVAGAGSLKEYAECFDSISLCFSKGLGAPIGSMITGTHAFIDRARHIRKMMGGGLRQAGIITAAARVGVEQTFLGGKLSASHERARRIARLWEEKGGKLAKPTESNMVWLDLDEVRIEEGADIGKRFVEAAVKEGIKVSRGRLVVHYQISDESVKRLGRVMDTMLRHGSAVTNDSEKETAALRKKAEEILAPEVE